MSFEAVYTDSQDKRLTQVDAARLSGYPSVRFAADGAL
jgi:hypothetical protein